MTGYTEFRQRLYRPRVPLLWWLQRRSYLVFVLRELTSVFVAWSVAFTLVVFHAVTWFNLTPQAIVVRVRGRRVPGILIAAPHFAAWVVLSALLTWIIL